MCKNSCCYSVTKSCPTLHPHELQHARLWCPPLSPGVCSNSCPLRWWCHPTILSSVAVFSSCPQSFPAWRKVFSNESALRIRWPKYWSFSFSISPSSEYSGLGNQTGLIKSDWFDLLKVSALYGINSTPEISSRSQNLLLVWVRIFI